MLALAENNVKAKIPWTKLGEDPARFLPEELIPEGVVFKSASHMSVAHRKAAIRLWLEAGYLYVKKTVSGRSVQDAAPGTAGPTAPEHPVEPLADIVINRYGACGREVLDLIGMPLYEPTEDDLGAHVMEDRLIDPAELDRFETGQHNHFAPITVPHTSEARAQYCMTLLELVSKGQDRATAIKCIKSFVRMPVSAEFQAGFEAGAEAGAGAVGWYTGSASTSNIEG